MQLTPWIILVEVKQVNTLMIIIDYILSLWTISTINQIVVAWLGALSALKLKIPSHGLQKLQQREETLFAYTCSLEIAVNVSQ